MTRTMQAVAYHAHGGPEQLNVEEWPIPDPGAGEVRVRVRVAALNGFDPMILGGTTKLRNPWPMVPCGDAAGEIDAVGEGVTGWANGDRVSLLPWGEFGMMGETAQGAAREYVTVPAANLIAVAASVSFESAAALPVAYGTAWRMLFARGGLRAGERLLVIGAAGGVGVACVQLAAAVGVETIAVATGAWKLERLRALGATHVVETHDLLPAVTAIAGRPGYKSDGGVDAVVNYVGGDSWGTCQRLLKRHGRMLVCGASAGHLPPTDARYLWSFEQSIVGSDGWEPEDQRALLAMVAEGRLSPAIHAVRPFAQAAESMRELIARQTIGKSLLVPG